MFSNVPKHRDSARQSSFLFQDLQKNGWFGKWCSFSIEFLVLFSMIIPNSTVSLQLAYDSHLGSIFSGVHVPCAVTNHFPTASNSGSAPTPSGAMAMTTKKVAESRDEGWKTMLGSAGFMISMIFSWCFKHFKIRYWRYGIWLTLIDNNHVMTMTYHGKLRDLPSIVQEDSRNCLRWPSSWQTLCFLYENSNIGVAQWQTKLLTTSYYLQRTWPEWVVCCRL